MNKKIKNILLKPFDLLYDINKEITLKILFIIKNGYKLNLENPVTYNEKLQLVKLYYKHPLLTKLVDKYTVREYVHKICPDILNELYWEGFNPNEIPWDNLPDKFVIKVTHGSGYNILCTNKNKINKAEVIKKINIWLKEKFIKCYGEWFYGVEKPRIIIEKYLDDETGKAPTDYKVFCFNGIPRYVIVDTDRFTKHKRNVYDLQWNFKNNYTLNFPNDKPLKKPKELAELLDIAAKLSKGFPHVRVDLYIIKGKIYFGEMTFTNGAGFDKIRPYEFDVELGSLFKIEKTKGL